MECLTKRQASIIHAAVRRGKIVMSDSLLDKLYRLTSNSESSRDQKLVCNFKQILFHIQAKQYNLAQAIIDGKRVEYCKVPIDELEYVPASAGGYFRNRMDWKWVIKEF